MRTSLREEFPDTVRREPKHVSSSASEAELVRAGLVASNYRWHWHHALEGKGYDPWHDENPHEKQQAFHALCDGVRDDEQDIRFAAFVGGLGSGKTLTGCAETVKWLIEHPGLTAIVAANSYKQLMSSTIPAFFNVLHPLALHSRNKGEKHTVLTNGSDVYFRTTTNPDDAFRGIDAAFFHVDEAAFASADAWNVIVGRLRQVGYPQGGVVTTTPNGHNWLFERFASEDATDGYDWVRVSATDNPWLSDEYLRSLRRTYGDSEFAAQEIHGEFVQLEGLVYPGFSVDTHVIDLSYDDEYGAWVDHTNDRRFRPEDIRYFVDWGYQNPIVCLLCLVDGDGRMIIADEYYRTQTLAAEMGRWVRENWVAKHGNGTMVCDPSEPDEIEKMARIGFPSEGANNEIMPGIQEVTSRLTIQDDGLPRLMVAQRCENVQREIRRYHYPETGEDEPAKETPQDKDDHTMDALRYGAMSLATGPSVSAIDNADLDLVV